MWSVESIDVLHVAQPFLVDSCPITVLLCACHIQCYTGAIVATHTTSSYGTSTTEACSHAYHYSMRLHYTSILALPSRGDRLGRCWQVLSCVLRLPEHLCSGYAMAEGREEGLAAAGATDGEH